MDNLREQNAGRAAAADAGARQGAAQTAGSGEGQYVTFLIAGETYGIEVLRVQEIIGMTSITRVPNTMDFMKGVINLRGMVVPVVDMRLKFSMEEKDYDAFTVIIIVEVSGHMIGLIVDSVSDVVGVPLESIQDTPHFSARIGTDFISGIGRLDETLIIMLDIDRVISAEELEELEKGKRRTMN